LKTFENLTKKTSKRYEIILNPIQYKELTLFTSTVFFRNSMCRKIWRWRRQKSQF